jgi:hypothetical protein
MYIDIIISIIVNIFLYKSKYSSLYNCSIISFFLFLKLLFYENYIINELIYIFTLNSCLFYTIDTFKIINNILLKNKTILNQFLIHHLFTIYILSIYYVFRYDIYTNSLLLFLVETSSISYNLYYYKFITKKIHKIIYIPLRIISSVILVYYLLYDIIYTYYIEYILHIFSIMLLIIFNISAILKF